MQVAAGPAQRDDTAEPSAKPVECRQGRGQRRFIERLEKRRLASTTEAAGEP